MPGGQVVPGALAGMVASGQGAVPAYRKLGISRRSELSRQQLD